MTIEHPIALCIASALMLGVFFVLILRRSTRPRSTTIFLALGTAMLTLAAGEPILNLPGMGRVVVMIDQSASTRTATFRDPKQIPFDRLFGSRSVEQINFSDDSAERTIFPTPPPADAIVLFSDCRFEPPKNSPPIFIFVDPNLEHPNDAAITDLEPHDDSVLVRGRNLEHRTVTQEKNPASNTITAKLSPGDAWPENDVLSITLPPEKSLRWRINSARDLPTEPTAYLGASAIILNNIAADSLSPIQQDRLTQYVHDLGGGLVILGGDHAFAAGAYPGSELENLSPLSSTPPTPQRQWLILLDSSGSMASRWNEAVNVAVELAAKLPPHDAIRIGTFSRDLTWWDSTKPPLVSPSGPTNLQTALQSIIEQSDGAMQTEIVLVSDADAKIDDLAALASALSTKKIRLNLLATADVSRSVVPQIVEQTSGKILTQVDPRLWLDSSRQLLQSAMPKYLEHGPTFPLWNRTWLKKDATAIGAANENSPLTAQWSVGVGKVAAAGFSPDEGTIESLAKLVESPPRDPRFSIDWKEKSPPTVSVDAIDNGRYLNGLNFSLHDDAAELPIPQVGPGKYEAALSSSRSPRNVTIQLDGHVIDRKALAGRYPPEFYEIGNDHAAMRALAEKSHGGVIDLSQSRPFEWTDKKVPISSWLAAGGGLMIALGLIVWRLR